MVQARGTTRDATALQWGAYRPSPFMDSSSVAITKEWCGSWGTFASVWRTCFVVILTLLDTHEFQWYAPLRHVVL
eukprot:14055126-Ditylum_brightwellii.AAC.3